MSQSIQKLHKAFKTSHSLQSKLVFLFTSEERVIRSGQFVATSPTSIHINYFNALVFSTFHIFEHYVMKLRRFIRIIIYINAV